MINNDNNGCIITFYSYKGGVGRSMAVVNLACLLARDYKRVLLLDWDLEAPGLHTFFKIQNDIPGFVDFITDADEALSEVDLCDENLILDFFNKNVSQYITTDFEINDKFSIGKLKIDLIKAGKFGNEYISKLNNINWLQFYKKYPSFFRLFARFLESKYDYILIDSRTGLADISGISTMIMPQKLVLVYALNQQNIDGVVDVAKQAINYRFNSLDDRSLKVYPLPSRLEHTIMSIKEWSDIYKSSFQNLFKESYKLDDCDLTSYFNKSGIPYFAIHAHGENIPVLTESVQDTYSIASNYYSFLDSLTSKQVIWDNKSSIPKNKFGRRTVKVFISSSSEVKEERDKCILILNEINKSHTHLSIEPVEWEYDLPKGSFPNFESIQNVMNPLLQESNLCIFIFNSKIGNYTEEEFELAHKYNKRIIAFFKEGFSPKTKDEIRMFSDLIDFKDSISNTQLYSNYVNSEDFELKLKDNIHLYLAMEFPPRTAYEDKPLPSEVVSLLKIINDKQEEIDHLKKSSHLTNPETSHQLTQLEEEKNELTKELHKNKEFLEQQVKEKRELELRLAPQIGKDSLKQQALTAIQKNKLEEANRLLKESAKDSISETASTFYELGKIARSQLNNEEALRYFELASRIQPEDNEINLELGRLLQDLGKYNDAITVFEKVLNLQKDNQSFNQIESVQIIEELGNVNLNIGNLDKALNYYERALSINMHFYGEEHPNIANIYKNLGQTYIEMGQYQRAIEYFKDSLKIDKKFFLTDHPNIIYTQEYLSNIQKAFKKQQNNQ